MPISGHVAISALQQKSPLTVFTAGVLGGITMALGLDTMEGSSALSYLQASYTSCLRHSTLCRSNLNLQLHISSGIVKTLLQGRTPVKNARCTDCLTDLPFCPVQ